MMLETERLILRRWEEADTEDLYKYASDPDVGPIAGWPAHQSIDESRDVIKNVFNGKEAYAICLKEDGKAIGAIELKHKDKTAYNYPLLKFREDGYTKEFLNLQSTFHPMERTLQAMLLSQYRLKLFEK